ncbi:hypothetical protein CDIK_1296 [Cucumispora dikerogammari]|nr:hypothetical protein CDIK_1296 [Cucumispora dikerogammari]
MLIQILLTLNAFLFHAMRNPEILLQPTMFKYKTTKRKIIRNFKLSLEYSKCLKTTIQFKDSSYIKTYKITCCDIIKDMSILFVDTTLDKNNEPVFLREAVFLQDNFEMFTKLHKKSTKIPKTNIFEILLEPEDGWSGNPLVQHLIFNPTKGFKMQFFVRGPTNIKINDELLKAIGDLEKKIQPLIPLLQNETIKLIEQPYDINTITVEKQFKISDLKKDIGALIAKISGIENTFEEIKELATTYLDEKNALLSLFYSGDRCFDDIDIVPIFIREVKSFFKITLESKLQGLDIENKYKNKITHAFNLCIEDCILERNMFLTQLFAKLEECAKEQSSFLCLETFVFKLNTTTGDLERVKEIDSKKKSSLIKQCSMKRQK